MLPLAPAVTPTVAGVGQALIAAARLEAKPEVVESTANVPVVLVGQVFVPLLPAVTAPQEKIPVLFDAPTERVPELPSVVLVTVTVLVLDVAVTPAAAGHRPIAVLRLVARVVVLELLAKVPPVDVGHVFEPSDPPLTAPHAKLLRLSATVKVILPGVVAVTATVLAVGLALTPAAAGHRAIAVATFDAKVDVLELVAKVPLVEVEQAFAPSVPAFATPHEKMPVLFAAPTEKVVKLPGVLEVAVTVLVLAAAVTPAATGHALIAAARLAAKVVVLELAAKVPVVELGHVFEPLAPLTVEPQLKPPADSAKVKPLPGFTAVTVAVLVLDVAVKPTAGKEVLQLLIASLRLAASVDVVALVTKVPAVALAQAFEPEVAAVSTSELAFNPLWIVIVWPALGVPLKVPVL
ncbi:MAG: hypothetical protein DMG27_14895 [Acidobacteria bacterium]|nr:MAG: hypothetical protein DMG27_14895 [Acidobacteriota bacterium]